MSETKSPLGWVMLTVNGEVTRDAMFRVGHILCVRSNDGLTRVDTIDQQEWTVDESTAEVAALIAAAEAAERRARALPVMSAIVGTRDYPSGGQESYDRSAAWAVRYAAAILDAIDAREPQQ